MADLQLLVQLTLEVKDLASALLREVKATGVSGLSLESLIGVEEGLDSARAAVVGIQNLVVDASDLDD